MPAEIELKLAIPPAAVRALLRHPALVAARSGRGRRARLVATYFDTPDFRLAQAGIGLRLRHENGRWVQTVKGPPRPESAGALVARDEFETPLAGPELDAQALAHTPWADALADALADPSLGPRFVTDFVRHTIPLRLADATTALLAVDCGELRDIDGEERRAVSEVEIELVAGATIDLFRFAAALAADLPLAIQVAGKAERGVALIRRAPDGWRKPVRAAAPTYPRECDAAAALLAIVRECTGQIAANAAGLLHDDDPEWVHQMRVGTRRLRSCLALVAPLLPAPGVDAVNAGLRKLADVLGRCRDLDVFVAELLQPLARAADPDSTMVRALAPVQQLADAARSEARAEARRVVGAADFTRLVLALGALGSLPRFGVPPAIAADDPLSQPVATFAAALLRQRHRRVRRRGKALAEGSGAERHALRIAAKKMRYAAEFFAPAFAHPKRARAYGASLAELQDALGQLNDGETAARLVATLTGGRPEHAEAAGAVAGWVAARQVAVVDTLAPAWKAFRRAPRFWRAG
jgi:inorganic triphosphatase YgiF